MTTPELITDEIVEKALSAIDYYAGFGETINPKLMRAAILEIQDDITRPVYALLNGWKRDAQAYETALKLIRKTANEHSRTGACDAAFRYIESLADVALKHTYHKNNPIEEGQ